MINKKESYSQGGYFFCAKSWIFYGFAAGLSWGLANTIFAVRCSKLGFWGVCLTGPIGLILLAYRIIEASLNKKRTGNFIDYKNSNFFKAIPLDDGGDALNTAKYSFNWSNLWLVLATQTVPAFITFISITYAFKFALLAKLNQGSISCLFSLTSCLVAILFYFKFNERLGCAQILGILAMIPTVLLLSFEKKEEDEIRDAESLSEEEMKAYGQLAVLLACLPPFVWTFMAY